ncbi:MAG: NAD(P)H-dependent oxidoreductase subunit E [Epsilonproteobacteria bacterium]|nr:MAG: NAD(P)H-dependent oxidoreductase subunit E [Campylobacterota bacterium]RLA66352.1 MAG: NAD(P)H-dependent oxidoreductase subunit E [Campylobacterota bacterium]
MAKRTNPKVDFPSDDKRWKILNATMKRNGYEGHALIETLHTAQDSFGYLDGDVLAFVAKYLNVSKSKVYGVATFYHYFNLKPPGKHTCVICTGTACYIKGADQLIHDIEDKYKINLGGTTLDGELSVMETRCIGACSLAPAVVLDGEIIGNVEENDLLKTLSGWMV